MDVGIKNNQLRRLANCKARIHLVPWDYDFTNEGNLKPSSLAVL